MKNDYNGLLGQLYGGHAQPLMGPLFSPTNQGAVDLGKNPGYGANSGMGQGQPVVFGAMPPSGQATGNGPTMGGAMAPNVATFQARRPVVAVAQPTPAVQPNVVAQPAIASTPPVSVPMTTMKWPDGSTHSVPTHMVDRYQAFGLQPTGSR